MRREARMNQECGRPLRGRASARPVGAALALCLTLAWLPGAASAEVAPVVVTATVEPTVATVGDRLHYALVVDRAEGVELALPDVVADLAPFEVLDVMISEPVLRDGRVVEQRDFLVAAFQTGELFVPALEFSYVTAEGDSGVAVSDSLAVTVESVLPEVREDQQVGPMDIKPPVELPRRIWPWIVAALAAAAIAVGVHFLRKWLRSRNAEPKEVSVEEPPVPRIAAHVVALERLDALERDDPIGRGDVPAFYVRVTEIVRLYLRDRFGVDAIDMTTSELAPAMREVRIEESEIEWGTRYLAHADLAKFAGHVPTEERARSDFGEARDLVERTRLRGEMMTANEGDSDAGGDAGGDAGNDAGEVKP